MKKHIDHADIVVTHRCNFNCSFCIDKYRNSPEKCENDISIV